MTSCAYSMRKTRLRRIPDLSVEQWMWAQRGVYRALAAIDALMVGRSGNPGTPPSAEKGEKP